MSMVDPLLDVYMFENTQLLEQLEEILLTAEKNTSMSADQIAEIFRIMHTIKGSSAMMQFDVVAHLAHAVEDLFSFMRERTPRAGDWSRIFDIVLTAADFLKSEMAKIAQGLPCDGDSEQLRATIADYVSQLKNRKAEGPEHHETVPEGTADMELEMDARYYRALVHFENECKMENVRAFGIVSAVTELCSRLAHVPDDILAIDADEHIVENGFLLFMRSDADPAVLKGKIAEALFLKDLTFDEVPASSPELPSALRVVAPEEKPAAADEKPAPGAPASAASAPAPGAPAPVPAAAPAGEVKQNMISVNINKLDKLMGLVGEIVTTESMVTKNPDIVNMRLDNFTKAARELRKLTDELQEVVMSIRMVPISSTFHKMTRIVRDMCKKVNKEAELVILGEETEVDKNIIDNLSDPLMHIIRNSMDHGLESGEERLAKGKPAQGKIVLEARNTGGDVIIVVSDDGRGLNREKIVKKAIEKGLTTKTDAELTDKEAYAFIMYPGFSTKEQVSEFSGRGVGMDVVRKNIEKVGGTMTLESVPDKGTTVTIKIPLTLAIMEGMQINVGENVYIVPVLTIQQSVKPSQEDLVIDPNGNELIIIHGESYPIVRLSERFGVSSAVTELTEGILMRVETDNKTACLFADELIGEVQAVVQPLPPYIAKQMSDTKGLAGCTLMGDGTISLILNINGLLA